MVRRTIAVSLTEEQFSFLGQSKDISPSHILQIELNKIMESSKSPDFLKELQEQNEQLTKNIKNWQEMFYKIRDFAILRSSEQEVQNLLL